MNAFSPCWPSDQHWPLTLFLQSLIFTQPLDAAVTWCTQNGVSTVTDGRTVTEVQDSGMTMMTIGGKKGVNLTETRRRILIIDMKEMDTAGQREQREVERLVIHLSGCTIRIRWVETGLEKAPRGDSRLHPSGVPLKGKSHGLLKTMTITTETGVIVKIRHADSLQKAFHIQRCPVLNVHYQKKRISDTRKRHKTPDTGIVMRSSSTGSNVLITGHRLPVSKREIAWRGAGTAHKKGHTRRIAPLR